MSDRPFHSVTLDNRLVLNLFNESSRQGDRWQVKLVARIDIPITGVSFQNSKATTDEVIGVLGEQTRFEKVTTRNFIPVDEKDPVFRGMCETFFPSSMPA